MTARRFFGGRDLSVEVVRPLQQDGRRGAANLAACPVADPVFCTRHVGQRAQHLSCTHTHALLQALGSKNILCMEDLIHEIYTGRCDLRREAPEGTRRCERTVGWRDSRSI